MTALTAGRDLVAPLTRDVLVHNMREALARLDRLSTVDLAVRQAPVEACHACGFDGALYFRHDASRLSLSSSHGVGDGPRPVRAPAGYPPIWDRLRPRTVEAELIRRRAAVIVEAGADHATAVARVLGELGPGPYVAAPVVAGDSVVGVIVAGRRGDGARIRELDRDLLWTFAERLGQTLKYLRLLAQVRDMCDDMAHFLASSEAALGGDRIDEAFHAARRMVTRLPVRAETREHDVDRHAPQPAPVRLTPREQEVLALLVEGASNADIAEHLVITRDTAKSHVKNILRKTGARNRSELISRYVRHLRSVSPQDLEGSVQCS